MYMFIYMYIHTHTYHITFSSHLTLYIIKVITINFSSYTLGHFNKFCHVSCIYSIAKRDNSEEYRISYMNTRETVSTHFCI